MDQITASSEEIQANIGGVLEKIKTAKNQLFSVLDDFTKYYVLHNKSPDIDEYTTIYNQNVSQIQGLQTEIFNINNAVERSTESINEIKLTIDESIIENKAKIAGLETQIDALNGGSDASIMKTDMVDMHNLQYLGNFCMFIGIVLVSVLFGVLFKDNALGALKSGAGLLSSSISSSRNGDSSSSSSGSSSSSSSSLEPSSNKRYH
jgi:hypothetical protein